jgi:hypothetical protein
MEVRIRRASEATARRLTTVGFDKLDTVIPQLTEIGLGGDDEDREMTGQIIVEEEGRSAYYEVVIDDGD